MARADSTGSALKKCRPCTGRSKTAVSGIYLVFQDQFVVSVFLGPAGRVASWLTQLHFGRFNWFTEALWALLGLIPAILASTGVFICCRRVIFKKPSNPNQTAS